MVLRHLLRDPRRTHRVALDDLDLVVLFELLRKTQPDVAAAGDHDAPHRFLALAHLAHHQADVLGGGEEEHLVAGLDHGVALRAQAPPGPVDRDHARVDVRKVLADVAQLLSDQQPALHGAHSYQPDAAAREVDDLQRTWIADQAPDVRGDQLLGTDVHVDGEAAAVGRRSVRRRYEEIGAAREVRGTDARNARRRAVERPRHVAGDHVDLVAVGQRDQHVGARGAGLLERAWARGIAAYGAYVEPVLQVAQHVVIDIHNGDVVGFLAGEMVSRGPADLAGAEDDDLHGWSPSGRRRPLFPDCSPLIRSRGWRNPS